MRVPLKISSTGLVTVTAILKARKYPMVRGTFKFVVDTGSPKSFISYSDIQRFSRVLGSLDFTEEVFIGGGRSLFANFGDVKLSLTSSNETLQEFESQEFFVSKERMMLPSILGTDFLRRHKIKICFDEEPPYLEMPG